MQFQSTPILNNSLPTDYAGNMKQREHIVKALRSEQRNLVSKQSPHTKEKGYLTLTHLLVCSYLTL